MGFELDQNSTISMNFKELGWDLLEIEDGDGQLQDSGETNPEEIRDLDISNPAHVGVNHFHRPTERDENKENIEGGEKIVLKSELDWAESEVENEIEDEGQSYGGWDFSPYKLIENCAEGDDDKNVEHTPYRTEEPRRRRPTRLQ